jgi:thiamine biosynthesis lipoprotein
MNWPMVLGIFGCGMQLAQAVSSADTNALTEWQGRTMGGPYTVKISGAPLIPHRLAALKSEVEQRLQEINRQMSHYQSDSELSRFNRAPMGRPFKVSSEFAQVVRFSLDLSRRSQGAFDPTLAPVINLWGFGEKTEQRTVPSEADLKTALRKTGWQHLRVTTKNELLNDLPELSVNLSAVAKGFGVDEMVRLLTHHGFINLYASIAGEVRVQGHNARGIAWQIGIAAPMDHWRENNPMVAIVGLSNQSISTSGDYQKFFVDPQGRRWCHIFDPRTGRPVQNNVGSVSVIASDSITADALGTTLFVLGPEAGLKLIETFTNASALFILHEGENQYRQISSSRFPRLTPP